MLNQNWKHIYQIFPQGGTYLDNKWYDNEDMQFLDLPQITSYVSKPARDMIEEEESVFWYENGDMERITTYCVFPPILVDNIPALNVYGQKMYNNFCAESSNNDNNSDEEINLDDFELYYSSL